MTIDEIRDAIAAKCAWANVDGRWRYYGSDRIVPDQSAHPIPASLDWVSENWPKDRLFRLDWHEPEKGRRVWRAFSGNLYKDAPTELHARLALLLAVLEAEGTR